MPIHKSTNQAPQGLPDEAQPLEIEIADGAAGLQDDGSMIIDLSGEGMDDDKIDSEHDENLADKLKPEVLSKISDDLMTDIESDLQSRGDWERTYSDGMKLLGLTVEKRTEPWEGACGIVHPILTEAVVRFQSEMMTETFPPHGPVKAKILGRETKEKHDAAERVRADMNIELTDRMTEYRREHERLLWNLPIAGTALKKIYFDDNLGRQASMFVAAEDFIVANGTTDLRSCPRYTQRMKMTKNDLRRLQVAGLYRDIKLDDPTIDAANAVENEKEKLSGQGQGNKAEHYTLYECCVDLSIPGMEDKKGIEYPYVITIEKMSGEVLAVRRNWKEEDAKRAKIQYFVDYHYIPGFGFYSFGLLHLVGGFAEGATAILRQLVDAGTLANLPGGLKTKGLRIKGDDTPIGPGEWRDVDIPSGMLKENLLPLPYKEPSVVLAALLDKIVEEGRKLAAVAEMKIADFDSNSPVGTTMALLERTLKVMTAVQSRIFDSMKYEFRLIKGLIVEHGDDQYEYDPETGDKTMRKADYTSVDILPVADPNAATMSQRIVQWQAVMQLIQMAPQIYDLPEAHGRMLTVLGVQDADKMIPALRAQSGPRDPVTENMAIMQLQPVKAFPMQDHKSHIAVHMAAMQDPMIQQMIGQNPQAPAIGAAANAHIVEHLAFEYRNQIEQQLGSSLPAPDQPLPPQIEYQLSGLIAQAAQKLLGQNQAFMQMMAQQAQQSDPIAQQQMMDTQVKMREVARKEKKDQTDAQLEQAKLEQKQKIDTGKLVLDEKKITTENTITALQEVLKMVQSQQDRAHGVKTSHQEAQKEALMGHTDRQHEMQMAQLEHQQGLQQASHQQMHDAGMQSADHGHQAALATEANKVKAKVAAKKPAAKTAKKK